MKTCGTCNLCCKVLAVQAVPTPRSTWCVHARTKKGCAIYGNHPPACRAFVCEWLRSPHLDEDWKPEVSKFVMRLESDDERICIDVDPDHPHSWQEPKYYNRIKEFSKVAWQGSRHVVVYIGGRVIAIFPEEDIDLGTVEDTDAFAVGYRWAADGTWRQPVAAVQRGEARILEKVGQRYQGGRKPV